MTSQQTSRIVFTADDEVRVRMFLLRMNSWFDAMGENFDGKREKLKMREVGQIYDTSLIRSVAWKFIYTFLEKVSWNEEVLREALIA